VGGAAAWFVVHGDRLPDPLAYDWSPAGEVAVTGPALPILISVLIVAVAVCVVAVRAAMRVGDDLPRRHVAAAIAVFGPGVLAGGLLTSLANQVDLASAGRAPSPHFWFALVILTSGLAAGIGWLSVTNPGHPGHPGATPRGSVAWSSWRGRAAGVPLSTFGVPAVISGLALLAAIVQADLLVPVVMFTAASALLLRGVARRRPVILADRDGLRLLLRGRERVRADIADITAVDVIHSRPLADFGGWGLRIGRGGRIGWVTRRGPALRVHRGFGGDVVVTVDEPEIPATVLATAMAEHLSDLDRSAMGGRARLPERAMLGSGRPPAADEPRAGGAFGVHATGAADGQPAAS